MQKKVKPIGKKKQKNESIFLPETFQVPESLYENFSCSVLHMFQNIRRGLGGKEERIGPFLGERGVCILSSS